MPQPQLKKQDLDNNKGLIEVQKPAPEDYIFGGKEAKEEVNLQPDQNWEEYLPSKELQNRGFETWACVSFATLNCIEVLVRRQYGIEANYSDRFLAKASDTKIGSGNYFSKVAQTVREYGLVPESVYPFGGDNAREFYKDIPVEVKKEAGSFNINFQLNYSWVDFSGVDNKKLAKAIKKSPIMISVYGWDDSLKDSNGVYQDPPHEKTNHAVMLFDLKEGEYLRIYDHYEDEIKKLAWDHYIGAAMKFSVNKRTKFKLIKAWQDDAPEVYAKDAKNVLHHIKPNMKAVWAGVEAGWWHKDIELTTKTKIKQAQHGDDIIIKSNSDNNITMSGKKKTLGQKIKEREQSLTAKYPILESSEGDGSVSKTFKGIAIAFVPVILTLAEAYGFNITKGLLYDIINVATILIAAGTTFWGLIRKAHNNYKKSQ